MALAYHYCIRFSHRRRFRGRRPPLRLTTNANFLVGSASVQWRPVFLTWLFLVEVLPQLRIVQKIQLALAQELAGRGRVCPWGPPPLHRLLQPVRFVLLRFKARLYGRQPKAGSSSPAQPMPRHGEGLLS
jgi:hypothetical protein